MLIAVGVGNECFKVYLAARSGETSHMSSDLAQGSPTVDIQLKQVLKYA